MWCSRKSTCCTKFVDVGRLIPKWTARGILAARVTSSSVRSASSACCCDSIISSSSSIMDSVYESMASRLVFPLHIITVCHAVRVALAVSLHHLRLCHACAGSSTCRAVAHQSLVHTRATRPISAILRCFVKESTNSSCGISSITALRRHSGTECSYGTLWPTLLLSGTGVALTVLSIRVLAVRVAAKEGRR